MGNAPWSRSRQIVTGAAIFLSSAAGAYAVLTLGAMEVRRPFLAQAEIRERQADGSYKRTSTITEAVRDDGSVASDTVALSDAGAAEPVRELWLTPTRTFWKYDPQTKSATSSPIDDGRYAILTAPLGSDCLSAHASGPGATCTVTDQKVAGYPVWKLSRGGQDSRGDWIQTEELVAPRLQWKTLKLSTFRNGELTLEQTTVSLEEGQPAGALFEPAYGPAVLSLAEYLDFRLRPRKYENQVVVQGRAAISPDAETAPDSPDVDSVPENGGQETRPRLAHSVHSGSADRVVADPAEDASQPALPKRVWRKSVRTLHHVFTHPTRTRKAHQLSSDYY